mmetsp:Transcript_59490/g.145703  ORF Transcript_59490/g.145703 Transcript_59490/m.145703 type:complete len:147 (-) Transcript_59490:4860-5300(-)
MIQLLTIGIANMKAAVFDQPFVASMLGGIQIRSICDNSFVVVLALHYPQPFSSSLDGRKQQPTREVNADHDDIVVLVVVKDSTNENKSNNKEYLSIEHRHIHVDVSRHSRIVHEVSSPTCQVGVGHRRRQRRVVDWWWCTDFSWVA